MLGLLVLLTGVSLEKQEAHKQYEIHTLELWNIKRDLDINLWLTQGLWWEVPGLRVGTFLGKREGTNVKKATWINWTRWDRSGPDSLLLHIYMIIFKDLEKNPLFLHTAMPEEKRTLDKEHFKN